MPLLSDMNRTTYTNGMHDTEYARRALGHVHVVPSDPVWAEQFLYERERLRPLLGHVADQLQHFGSTAVPGLSAKPIIDMMAPVFSLDEADALGHRLTVTGYRKIDAGFFRRRFFRKEAEEAGPAFHLHLAVCPTWPIKNELLLRDWLIQYPEVARAYEALKMELAAAYGDDMPRYTAGKTSFLRGAVNDARLSIGLPIEQDWEE
ncbi:GrpB family protein [Acidobacterium sp. S8]|uniref:GrpB family protein n=1 Tax=Acidobacterium sp. S8 TaxID=1641854 RepID=UPI00131CC948|nr:GrpB family protein [Acidobacterium sp. S8]